MAAVVDRFNAKWLILIYQVESELEAEVAAEAEDDKNEDILEDQSLYNNSFVISSSR